MSLKEAFRQALRENPADEASWLVFADWPEEQGDPSAPRYRQRRLTNSIGMEFVLVLQGTFRMGGGGGLPGKKLVAITQDFYLGRYEVTQGQWQAVMGSNLSYFCRTGGGKDAVKDVPDAELNQFPVEKVSWEDAQQFIKKLNGAEKSSGWVYRLPTEAEWEYSCRGGAASQKACSFDFYLERPRKISRADWPTSTAIEVENVPPEWARTPRTGWGYTTSTATSGSGARTPTTGAGTGSSGAAVGAVGAPSAGRPAATGKRLGSGTAAWVSAWLGFRPAREERQENAAGGVDSAGRPPVTPGRPGCC
jgi:uncharacterized protein (TIGR02996 family)